MTRNEAIEKIRKCLALAQSDNPGEREAALRQANKLMAQHAVEMADVHAAAVECERIGTGVVQVPAWMHRLAGACARAFDCDLLVRQVPRGLGVLGLKSDFDFIGIGPAAGIASYAYEVLLAQLERERTAHVAGLSRRCKMATKRRRGDEFAHGFVDGVRAIVNQFAGRTPEADRAIEAYTRQHYHSVQTKPVSRGRQLARDAGSRSDGHAAGSAAQLHHGVGADQRRPAGLLEG